MAGMAVSVLPESALRPGMKVLTQADGFPPLAPVQIGIMRRPGLSPSLSNAITSHITACLDNITPLTAADDLPEAEVKMFPRMPRARAGNILPGW